MTSDFCPGCGHFYRYSNNEAGRCEKIINSEEGTRCGHICNIQVATTCDWGDCDGDQAVGYRFDDDADGLSKPGGYGWLPVCQAAYDEELDPNRKRKDDGQNHTKPQPAGLAPVEPV